MLGGQDCFLKVIQSQLKRLFDKHKRIALSCLALHNFVYTGVITVTVGVLHVSKLGVLHTCEQFCKTIIRRACIKNAVARGYAGCGLGLLMLGNNSLPRGAYFHRL